jgi:hypothetical protein
MSNLLVALSNWLHVLATIVMIGHYFFTSLIYLPVLERHLQANALRDLLELASARLRPFFGGSLLIPLLQIADVAATLRQISRWRQDPQRRPSRGRLWGLAHPASPNPQPVVSGYPGLFAG